MEAYVPLVSYSQHEDEGLGLYAPCLFTLKSDLGLGLVFWVPYPTSLGV